jgi:hypothetical protein
MTGILLLDGVESDASAQDLFAGGRAGKAAARRITNLAAGS